MSGAVRGAHLWRAAPAGGAGGPTGFPAGAADDAAIERLHGVGCGDTGPITAPER
ncbi:MAG: hypothetical protein OEY70_13430 [Acidimicrobiia bacterium]|nr:hypothetical protein [Acidimicrobiia bacterium]